MAETRRLSAETHCCRISFRMFCGAVQRRLPNHLLGGVDHAGEHDGLVIAVALAWRLGFNVKRARCEQGPGQYMLWEIARDQATLCQGA